MSPDRVIIRDIVSDRALRYFLAVLRAGSVRGAAGRLNVAASAISRQILELEEACGGALLERLPRGVAPTEAGRVVAEHARRREEELGLLADRLHRLRGLRGGTVRLCCGAGFLPDLLENGLAALSRDHPGLAFRVTTATSDGILAALAQGEADLGLAYAPPAHPGVRSLASAEQPLHAVVPPAHPLAAAGAPVPLRDLADGPVVLLPPDHGIRRLLARAEADGGFRLTPRLETGAFELHRRFVAAGMGTAFLPGFAMVAERRAGTLAAVPLADPVLAGARAHLLAREGRRLPEAAGHVAEWLAARLAALGAF